MSHEKSRWRKSIYNLTSEIDSLVILCGLILPRAIKGETYFLCAAKWNTFSQNPLQNVNRLIRNGAAKVACCHVFSGRSPKHVKLHRIIQHDILFPLTFWTFHALLTSSASYPIKVKIHLKNCIEMIVQRQQFPLNPKIHKCWFNYQYISLWFCSYYLNTFSVFVVVVQWLCLKIRSHFH